MNEQALKERLKHIARNQNKTFQEVWKLLVLERFLVRLSLSDYRSKLIFKGGLLLTHYLSIARETSDLDFLAKQLQVEIDTLRILLENICKVETGDGFSIELSGIDELEHAHMNYPGYRAKFNVRFSNMKDRIQVDIGVGDSVLPDQISWKLFQYKGKPIFEESVSLQVYPFETIFSEKLETIITRGSANSRMKDFHDLILMCRNDEFVDIHKLKSSIDHTFRNRNSSINLPMRFSPDELKGLQALWISHLRTLSAKVKEELNLPSEISELINELNSWFKIKLIF
jgi:predicted nucleotidyltransferase component of viral defense system